MHFHFSCIIFRCSVVKLPQLQLKDLTCGVTVEGGWMGSATRGTRSATGASQQCEYEVLPSQLALPRWCIHNMVWVMSMYHGGGPSGTLIKHSWGCRWSQGRFFIMIGSEALLTEFVVGYLHINGSKGFQILTFPEPHLLIFRSGHWSLCSEWSGLLLLVSALIFTLHPHSLLKGE